MNRSASDAGGVLPSILQHKRLEVRELARQATWWRREAETTPAPPSLEAALRDGEAVAVIGEVKRRSPSAGALAEAVDVVAQAAAYAGAGAAAISVLTDGPFFGGSVADLEAIHAAVTVPLLRKDFTLDAVQLWQAKAVGAAAVLLIVRVLDDAQLAALHGLAGELGLAALVEVHDAAELERALAVGARIVGVNNRDLDVLTVDAARTERLSALVPPGCILVGESGVQQVADVVRLARAGVDAVLVGEALMRSRDPAAMVRALAGVARERRG